MIASGIATARDALPLLALVGGLFVVLGLPMWLGLTRRNWLYGVRTPTSMASDESWQRMNKVAGRVIVGWGVVLLALAALVAVLDTGTPREGVYTAVVTIPVLVGSVHMTIAAIRAGRRAEP